MRPSYAQMAQKPRLSSASKSPTEVTNGKEVRKGSNKQEETPKVGKNNNQKSNNEEKESQKKDADSADKSGLTSKTQKQPRDARLASDSGTRNNQKPADLNLRSGKSNSFSGQVSTVVKESYASKSSANTNVQGAASKASIGIAAQTQNKASKPNIAKVANESGKSQKETEANSSTEEVQDSSEEPVAVNAEENNNLKGGEEGDRVEEN